jgi:predicted phage-related endonuclease
MTKQKLLDKVKERCLFGKYERHDTITGTAASNIMGFGFTSPYKQHMLMRGEVEPDEENEFMYWGRAIEPAILARFQRDNPDAEVFDIGPLLSNSKDRDLGVYAGTPDAMAVMGDGRFVGIEAKCTSGWAKDKWGNPGTDEVPFGYMIQCQLYMWLTGIHEWYVCALVGGNDYKVYNLKFKPEMWEGIHAECTEFFGNMIMGRAPKVDGSKDAKDTLNKRYAKVKRDRTIPATHLDIKAIRGLVQSKGNLKELQKKVNETEGQIKARIGDDYAIEGVDKGELVRATWYQSTRQSTAWREVVREIETGGHADAKVLSEIIGRHSKVSESRTFKITIKEKSDE